MNLMADWLMPYQGILDIRTGRQAKCRVRVYEHASEVPGKDPLVLITELPENAGEDISSAAEILVGTLLAVLQEMIDLSTSRTPMFINHFPGTVDGQANTYELVDFDQPEILELVVDQHEAGASAEKTGHTIVWSIEDAHFVPLEAGMVEALMGMVG